jgi:glycerol-3-phosphate acyltransferase PlsX
MVTVALDAMGGDHAPRAIVQGAAQLSREDADVRVLVVGDPTAIGAALAGLEYDPTRLLVVGADGRVEMSDDPRVALEQRPECSIAVASRLVKDGDADALVSAGSTGATILQASRTFQRVHGIRRCALASVYPTEARHGPHKDPFALILDAGATVDATAADLVGFAVMGAAYSSVISQIPSPRIALLSNGAEASKGTKAIVEAHRRLAGSPLNFAGNIEGLDIPRGTVDVVVCDGFLGNVVLKMLEGVSDVIADMARDASARSLQWRLGLSMLGDGLRQLRRMTDWKSYGGAPLLGLDRVVIKAHGRSEARAIRNAIKVAAKAVRGGLIAKINDGAGALALATEQSS